LGDGGGTSGHAPVVAGPGGSAHRSLHRANSSHSPGCFEEKKCVKIIHLNDRCEIFARLFADYLTIETIIILASRMKNGSLLKIINRHAKPS